MPQTHTEPGPVTQIMGTFSVAAPGCPDTDLSQNGAEVKGAFTEGRTSQAFPT